MIDIGIHTNKMSWGFFKTVQVITSLIPVNYSVMLGSFAVSWCFKKKGSFEIVQKLGNWIWWSYLTYSVSDSLVAPSKSVDIFNVSNEFWWICCERECRVVV